MTASQRKRLVWVCALGVALCGPALGGGCRQERSDSDGRPTVVCTTTMIADLAANLVGDKAHVIGIMRPGEDPHIYEPKTGDVDALADADLVLYNGLHLEGTLLKNIQEDATGLTVALAESDKIVPLGAAGAADPHCWMNVRHFIVYAERACQALQKMDPPNAEHYRQRTDGYVRQLEALDREVRAQIAAVPRERRVMVTSHDAFAYYGQAYDIDVHAVIGISTEEQIKPDHVEKLEALVRDRGVRAAFIETSVSRVLNDTVREIAARTGVRIGGTLFSDSLDEPGRPGGSYLGMIRHNTSTIVEALK